MPAEIPTPPQPQEQRGRRRALYVAGAAVVGLVALLLLLTNKKGGPQPGPQPDPAVQGKGPKALFVPRELAAHESLDRDGVLAYCRKLKSANYPGVLRGAHGALWAGEANRWDRVLLAAEALAGIDVDSRIVPGEHPRLTYRDGDKWHTLRLDVDEPPQATDQPPAGAVSLTDLPAQAAGRFHTVRPVLVLEKGGAPQRVEASAQPVADWVHQPVFVSAVETGASLEYVLSVGGKEVLRSGPLAGVRRASLELSWQAADHPSTWVRELFDVENTSAKNPGHDTVRKGDRYAVVLAAGPLDLRVLTTRLRMTAADGLTPLADDTERLLLGQCVKYQVDCDDRARALAEETKVEVAWTEPRITIAAAEVAVTGTSGLSLDALADAVEATGPRAREFHVARGLTNDVIETRVVFEARRKPVVSASTVFSNYKATSPDSAARRIAIIEGEAKRLLAHETVGATVKLDALPPLAPSDDPTYKAPDCPPLTIERTSDGLALRGLSDDKEIPGQPWTKYRWDANGRASFGPDTSKLAHTADALMCRQIRRADHVLKCTPASGWPLASLPVVPGSLLEYSAREDKKEQRFGVRVALKDGAATDGKAPLAAGWPKVATPGKAGALLAPRDVLEKGEPVKVKVRVGESDREVAARKVALADGASATLLDCPTFPLVLAWEQGKNSLALTSAGPVVQGHVRDRDTGVPAPATVSLARTAKSVRVREPLELRGWKAQGPDGGGKWALAPDGRSVMLPSTYYPSFYISPEDVFETTVRGTLEATESARHPIGFVLGYRSPVAEKGHKETSYEFLLFAWAPEGHAAEGFTLARVKGTFTGTNTSYPPFEDMKKQPGFEVLASKRGKGTGYLPKIEYPFEVTYQKNHVRVVIDGHEVFDVKGEFAPGRFGFFNYWQEKVRYRLLAANEETVQVTTDAQVTAPVAVDGSYALPGAPVPPRLILILDRSGSMDWDLDPKRKQGDPAAKKGEQRMDYLKKEVHGLLDKLPAGVEVALWSFSSGGIRNFGDRPEDTRTDCAFTTDLARVRKALDAIQPGGGTPITGAVYKLLNHVQSDPQSRDAVAVLLTDGQNDCKQPSAQDAYRQRKGKTVIHTIGFAIAPGGKEEKEMQELARVSGGLYRLAGTGEALKLAFEEFRTNLLDVRLRVTSSCHSADERTVGGAQLGRANEDFGLTHGCAACKCKDQSIIAVTKETAARVKECDGLSPKARKLIEARVKDGTWVVTVPTTRVNIGPVSAYAWFETEKATGRLVGRTEDGLHGSIAEPPNFPEAVYRAGHAYLTWFQGIVSYTTGSVEAGLRWHREPGFLNGTPEDFKRFVQANALAYAAKWWSEFGDAAFPESISAYWTGVCLNFTLQSMAFQMPSTDCLRYWGKALCKQLGDKLKSMPSDWAKEQVGKTIDAEFGPQLREYVENVKTWAERVNRSNAGEKEKEVAKDFLGRAQKWAQDVIDGKVDAVLQCDKRIDGLLAAP